MFQNATLEKCNPLLLQNAYLPTMPEDYLLEAMKTLGGNFYGNRKTLTSVYLSLHGR